ncbi:MAG: hypothetical protein FOGNACKC_00346 [Anaerolineae bacterium]|nr:hypothetical protein [Anaerolineae bacterium]
MKHAKLRTKFGMGARLVIALVVVFVAIIGGVMAAAAAPAAQTGPNPVDVTVEDANGSLANRTVYVFDATGSTYLGLSATTGAAGEPAAFSLADGAYVFASDDVNGTRYFSAACDTTTGCVAATITEPVFGAVDVTVTDGANPIANQVVYVFDGTGTTYLNLSAVTGANGEAATFNLPSGDYKFAADDTNGTRYFTANICTVPTCTSDTLTLPVFGAVDVTVEDANGSLANRTVYVFDGTGTTYLNLSAVTGANGEAATFNLPGGAYVFASDDVNGTRYFSAACDTTTGCVAATITEPVFGAVDVTVTDGANPVANQVVYVFNGAGTTYLNLSATTNGAGVATFNLPSGDYKFAADDTNGTRYFTANICTVPTCTSDTLTLPVFGAVDVTVEDANGLLANRTVYVFDGTGTTYLNLSAVTGANGEAATFNLPGGVYTFASDDVNNQRYFSAACDTTGGACTTATITEPVFGAVDVTVTDGANPVANQVVYAFDGAGTTYLNLSATTGPAGEAASFNLPAGDYLFASDDTNGTRFFTANVCTVPGCTSANLLLAAFVPTPITITVTSADGGAVAGQNVRAFTLDATSGITAPTAISGTTDVSGTVTLDLADGNYVFIADDTNGARYSSAACDVPTCTSANLFLFSAVTVSVVDTTGAEVPNQMVYVFDDANTFLNLTATTDVSGTVSFNLGSGNYMFYAYDTNGGGYGSVPVPCTTPDCTAATITMPVLGLVEVTVSDGINTVPGKLVSVYTVDATTGATATTTISDTSNISGTVTFTLASGGYQFAADDALGTTFFSPTCDVPACASISLVLAALEPVTVTVQDTTGALLDNQIVYALDNTGAEIGITATTNISGTVNLNLPAGDYTFAADSATGTRYFSALCTLPGCTDALITLPASAVTLPAATCSETGGVRTCELWATGGTLTLADGNSVDIWGYTDVDPVSGGTAQLPGPMLIVNQGETIEVILHNDLPNGQASSLLFKGLDMIPDLDGAPAGGTTTYTFDAARPGTYLYQAGLTANGARQLAMGLYGALIIRPVDGGGTPILDQAYGSSSSSFDDETLLVLSEIDPAFNANPGSFDLRNFEPQYWLINGKTYPQTGLIQTLASHKVLLRYLNAGLDYHSMGVLGLAQTLHGNDGNPLPGPHNVTAETLASGQTLDAIVSIPAATGPDSQFALYDTNVLLHNAGDPGFGGMMTFLATLPDGTTRGLGGPATLEVTLNPDSTASSVDVDITALISDVDNGGDNIQIAEYFVGGPGSAGSGTALSASDGAFDSPTEDVQGTIPASALASLPSGNFTIYVHGQDDQGNWGALHPVVLHLDKAGPATTGLELTPNPGGGNVDVTLTGTADDRLTGNSNVIAARYSVDGGAANPMTVNVNAPIASLNAVLDVSGLSAGIHTVAVESQDDYGHWGAAATIDLLVDQTGPDTVVVGLLPSANNGSLSVNASLFSMRVNATISDPATNNVQSNIKAVEGFIDYQPGVDQDGTGFPLTPADGQYNSALEDAYAFIPLSTVNALADGVHTIGIHGQDASGNWGTVVNAQLIIERDTPTVSGLSAAPNPTAGSATVALAAAATDPTTDIVLAEWFAGADPGQGNGMPMAVAANGAAWDITGVVDVTGWADGDYTISVRARDAAGNWSAAISTVITVADAPTPVANQLYFSTVGGGNANPVPGVPGPYDDADIYHWDGSSVFTRFFDATAMGLFPHADIDGLKIDGQLYYMSFGRDAGTDVPGLGGVPDEDIVFYDTDNGEWDFFFNGADACGLNGTNQRDIDAFDIVGGVLYFSTLGNDRVNSAGVDAADNALGGPYDDADIYIWNGATCSRFWTAQGDGGLPGNADIDGLTVVDADTFYISFNRDAGTNVPGIGTVQDEDVVLYDQGVWSLFFDGSAYNLDNSGGQDLDAIDVKW